MIEHYLDWEASTLKGKSMADFERAGYVRVEVNTPATRAPHRDGKFSTPSGKAEMESSLASAGNVVAPPLRQMYAQNQGGEFVDPLPGYVPCRESAATNPALARQYPLNIISPKSHGFLNSCYANEAHKIRDQGEQFVLIHPSDARARPDHEWREGASIQWPRCV